MKKTENYAMPYPEQDDYFNVEDFQNMMVSVDNLMKKLSDSGAQISSDAEHLYNQTKAQMDNIQKRMNTFTSLKDGSTTGDAELTDIRVAYDGKEYGNAGEAVREQASDMHKAIFGAGASIWSKAKSESTKYVVETKGICILNERFTAAGVVAKISRGTFAQNESTLNLDRECSAYIVEFEKNPGTVYMPSAETIKIVSTTKIIFEANGNARCWIPVEKGQYLAVDSTATAYTCESNHVPYMLYDQTNKTLECRGFGSAGSIEPVDPYSLALEYKLEYDMDDTGLVKQIDANREAAASLKENLGNLVNGTQEVITIPDTVGYVTGYIGYSQEIAKVRAGEKWIVLFDTFSNGVSIRNLIDSWNGISNLMDTRNICELQIPVDGSLRLNVENTTYSGTYYAYNVTNKATLSDYLEKNGINGLYKIYIEKNEEYIKQYVDSIDPLTDSELFSTKNIASDGVLDFREYKDSLASYTSSINIGTDYIFVAELEVENKSGFEIYSMYLSEGLPIRKPDGRVICYAPVLDFDGKYATGSSVYFENVNLKNNTKKTFKVLGRINTNNFTTNKIYWTLGFNRFREKNSDVNITTGISGICKNVWIFADNQDSDKNILALVGQYVLNDNIFVEHCVAADTANKIDSIFNGKKLTTYGDSITANGGWQSYLKDYFGFIIENKGIGGTTVADNGNGDSFCIQNRIDTISSDSDVVIVMGGTNDCGQSIEIGDLTYSNGFDTTKFKGGLATTIRMIQNRCPNALILVASLCGGRGNEAGENLDVPVYNSKNLTSYDYAKATKDVAEFFNIQYVPVFEECGINCWNRATYIADTVHPNDFGKKQLAKIFIKYLASYLIN